MIWPCEVGCARFCGDVGDRRVDGTDDSRGGVGFVRITRFDLGIADGIPVTLPDANDSVVEAIYRVLMNRVVSILTAPPAATNLES